MSNKIIKSVSFNPIANGNDEIILKAIKRRNFSGYVKKLILEDIRTKEQEKGHTEAIEAVKNDEPKSAGDRLEQLKKKSGKNTAH